MGLRCSFAACLACISFLYVAAQAHDLAAESLYAGGFTATDIQGRELWLAELAGKVTLVVNVASQCGYTDKNYRAIKEAWDKYHDYGFEVLAFPCNQFGGQEPGEAAQIESFVVEKYAVGFPLMAKVEVNGPSQHPVFAWLKAHSPAGPGRQKGIDISWNFEKFLVDKHGRAVKRYGSDIQAHELEEDVYNELTRGEAEAELR